VCQNYLCKIDLLHIFVLACQKCVFYIHCSLPWNHSFISFKIQERTGNLNSRYVKAGYFGCWDDCGMISTNSLIILSGVSPRMRVVRARQHIAMQIALGYKPFKLSQLTLMSSMMRCPSMMCERSASLVQQTLPHNLRLAGADTSSFVKQIWMSLPKNGLSPQLVIMVGSKAQGKELFRRPLSPAKSPSFLYRASPIQAPLITVFGRSSITLWVFGSILPPYEKLSSARCYCLAEAGWRMKQFYILCCAVVVIRSPSNFIPSTGSSFTLHPFLYC